MTYSEEEQKVLFLFNENFTHNVILCIFESDNIIYASMGYIILRVSQTRQKENAHHGIICKKRLGGIFRFNEEFCCECWQRRDVSLIC